MGASAEKSELLQLAEDGLYDPVFFCRYFLEHLFQTPLPWFHRGLLAILTRQTAFLRSYGELDKIESNFVMQNAETDEWEPIFLRQGEDLMLVRRRFTLIKIPRGFSKTTIAGIATPIYDTVYQLLPYGMFVSESGTHANKTLNSVKWELSGNSRIKAVFGALEPAMRDAEKWTDHFFETKTGVAWEAKGRGSQIRGSNHKGKRPKKIIVDDVEDKESVATDEQRLKVREWAYGDLMPALPELEPDATLIALGTLLHQDALIQTWSRDPQFCVVSFGAHDRDGQLLWPQNLDEKKLEAKRRSFALAGQLHTYYMEYFNEVRAAEGQAFRQEFFKVNAAEDDFMNAIFCDPAISQRRTADRAAVWVVGMNMKTGRIRVQDGWAKRGALPREIVDVYFALHERWDCRRAGVESNAFQAALVHIMREEMFRKKRYFEIEAVTHHKKNEERIRGILQPRYASGYVEHRQRFPELEVELLDFPRGAHDDNATAVAGAVALLDPYAPMAAGDDADPSDDQYDDEINEEALVP
jgi:hypothetical protein